MAMPPDCGGDMYIDRIKNWLAWTFTISGKPSYRYLELPSSTWRGCPLDVWVIPLREAAHDEVPHGSVDIEARV